jgi:hypothetical protein
LSTNTHDYRPGSPVVMRVSIINVSSRSCAIGVGPTSPTLSIINTKGDVIWNNCYAGDQPGACAMFLMLRTLKPGPSYALAKSWNQRTGPEHSFAARGTYVLTSNVSGLGGEKKVDFALIA